MAFCIVKALLRPPRAVFPSMVHISSLQLKQLNAIVKPFLARPPWLNNREKQHIYIITVLDQFVLDIYCLLLNPMSLDLLAPALFYFSLDYLP